MSRYQTGHILGVFPVRFYQTESRDGQVTRVRKSHRLCAEDRGHHSEKSKPVSLSEVRLDGFQRSAGASLPEKG
jgi:hypothetical protein